MSKIRKKQESQQAHISEIDVKFQKILYISGIFFLLACIGTICLIIALDIMNIMETERTLNKVTFSFMIFNGTSSGFTFGISAKMKKTPDQKRHIFFDWLLAQFLLTAIAIFTIAAYQW
ncbi:MAG: hypothetical protein ACFFAS_07910 [Promethearchaeota archaeon]